MFKKLLSSTIMLFSDIHASAESHEFFIFNPDADISGWEVGSQQRWRYNKSYYCGIIDNPTAH